MSFDLLDSSGMSSHTSTLEFGREPNATLIEVLGSKDCLHRVARERVVPVAQAPLQHLHASLEV